MPSITLILCALGAVAGVLAVSEAPFDVRAIAVAACAGVIAYYVRERTTRLLAVAVAVTFAASFVNAGGRAETTPHLVEGRTARYDAGALQLAFAWCAPLAQGIANVDSWFLAWMLGVVRALASLPGAALPMRPAPA